MGSTLDQIGPGNGAKLITKPVNRRAAKKVAA
jgi:hypothetical protein